MASIIDIRLNRYSKIYSENEQIRGSIIVQSKSEIKHDGVILSMDGSVNIQLSSKTVGIFEAFYQSVKPIQLLGYQNELVKPGKIPAGRSEFSFDLPLRARNTKTLFETYHGVFINIQYSLKCEIKKSFLVGTTLSKSTEFILEYGSSNPVITPSPSFSSLSSPTNAPVVPEFLKPAEMTRVDFEMITEAGSKLGFFKAHGHVDSSNCPIGKPFTGEIIIDKSEFPIKSVEIQLVRVETTGCAEGFAKDASEIQTIQIGDGNVIKGLPIPIFMVFPRLFSCPTLLTTNFKIEFEVNMVVIFANDFYKSENIPIRISRF